MNSKDRIQELFRKYIEGKLSDEEAENLFFLIHDRELEDAAFDEQYRLWERVSGQNMQLHPEETFGRIREKLKITDEKLIRDDLILKGLEFTEGRSRKNRVYAFFKYAAVFFIAAFLFGAVYYLTGTGKNNEITYNEITVPYGSKIKIVLEDSSVVWMNSGSVLIYPNDFSETGREVHLEGEAYFNIHKVNHKPFYVRTDDLNIKVLGTQFNVKAYPDEDIVETSVVFGSIQIEKNKENIAPGIKKEKIHLGARQKAVYSKNSQSLMLEKVEYLTDQPLNSIREANLVNVDKNNKDVNNLQDVGIETAWKDNQLIFRNERFESLSKKLERWYNVEIRITDDEIKDYRFTGSIENETVEQAMDAFRIASSLDYTIDRKTIEITKSNK